MFDFVPFARLRREVTHRNGDAGVVGQALEFEFPEAQPPAVAAAGIRRDQDHRRVGIEAAALVAPPAADRRDRKGAGVVIGPKVDEPGVPPNVVNAVRIRTGLRPASESQGPARRAAVSPDAIDAPHSRSSR